MMELIVTPFNNSAGFLTAADTTTFRFGASAATNDTAASGGPIAAMHRYRSLWKKAYYFLLTCSISRMLSRHKLTWSIGDPIHNSASIGHQNNIPSLRR
jgi:hypothetical protein